MQILAQLMNYRLVWALLSKINLLHAGLRLLVVGAPLLLGNPAWVMAEVFYAKDEALAIAFPDADEIETKSFILDELQLQQAQEKAMICRGLPFHAKPCKVVEWRIGDSNP